MWKESVFKVGREKTPNRLNAQHVPSILLVSTCDRGRKREGFVCVCVCAALTGNLPRVLNELMAYTLTQHHYFTVASTTAIAIVNNTHDNAAMRDDDTEEKNDSNNNIH